MTTDELRAAIIAQFPAWVFLLNIPDPEVQALLLQAVDPNTTFDAVTFEAKLESTNWWKTTSESQRQWDAMASTDPAKTAAIVAQREADVTSYAAKLGITLTADQLKYIAVNGLRDGVAVGSAMFNANIVGLAPSTAQGAGGDLFSAYSQINELANGEYMVGLDPATAWDWAKKVVGGTMTLDTVRSSLQATAVGKFPQLSDLMLKQGVTPGTYFAPYKTELAQTMEVSPDQIDFTDPKWSKVLQTQTNDGTGFRPMSLSEAVSYAKSLPDWRNTMMAKQQGADLTATLLQTFGEAKF